MNVEKGLRLAVAVLGFFYGMHAIRMIGWGFGLVYHTAYVCIGTARTGGDMETHQGDLDFRKHFCHHKQYLKI